MSTWTLYPSDMRVALKRIANGLLDVAASFGPDDLEDILYRLELDVLVACQSEDGDIWGTEGYKRFFSLEEFE